MLSKLNLYTYAWGHALHTITQVCKKIWDCTATACLLMISKGCNYDYHRPEFGQKFKLNFWMPKYGCMQGNELWHLFGSTSEPKNEH